MLRPSIVGALYMIAQAARAAVFNVQDDQSLGDASQAREIHDFIYGQFGKELTRIALAIGASALIIGAALGALAGLLVAVRDRIAQRAIARSPVNLALHALWLTMLLHGLLELWSMAHDPQLYAEWWYARGGIWRGVQVLATDFLGPSGVVVTATVFVAAYLAGPPSRWRTWPSRLSTLAAGQGKNVAAASAAAVALALLATALRAPAAAHAGNLTTQQPNVLIIAADSMRADRITPKLTPALSAIGDKGTRFDRAFVSFPRTFPSWVSILTGRHPHHHGIRSMFPRWEERAKDFDALPARLAKAGYATGVVSDYAGDIFGRIDLGFRDVDTPTFDFKQLVRQRALERQTPLLPVLHSRLGRSFFPVLRELNDAADPDMLTRDAIGEMKRLEGKPFFLTVFYSTAHFPYAAPAPYYRRYTFDDYAGRFKYHKPVGLGREAPPDERDTKQVQGLYDGAVASIDDAAAKLLSALESEGLASNTIVIVTSDHGETLYDHEHGQGHGDHLFGDEATHVPLLIYDPRKNHAGRVTSIVRDVDIAPTLYALTGVDAPGDLDGRSLAPALDGATLTPALAYAETGLWFTEEIPALPPSWRLPYPGIARLTELDPAHGDEIVLQQGIKALTIVAKHRMVRDEKWKLIYMPTRSGVKYLLFDTEADPNESQDVAAEHGDVVTKMKSELWAWMLRDPNMVERGGYLVPRDVASLASGGDSAGIRLGELGRSPPAPSSSEAAQRSPPEGAQP